MMEDSPMDRRILWPHAQKRKVQHSRYKAMYVTLIGLSHKTAPIELRERLHIEEGRIPDTLNKLHSLVPEVMLFSTCNRFEILSRENSTDPPLEVLKQFISEQKGIPQNEFEPYLYCHVGPEAVRHVFRVTSSLDSMVVGEPQILGQMKQFFSLARRENTIAFALNSIMERAFMTAKKIRSETGIATNPVSVSSVAVELACKIFDRMEDKTAFIIGAGKMSVLAIQHLRSKGVRQILVANRTHAKAEEIAQQVEGKAVPFEERMHSLAEADIVISSTGSSEFIIGKDDAQYAMGVRKNRPMFFIDIAVPRDVDPQINTIDNVFLYDIDDLKAVTDKNRRERQKEAEKAETIIEFEADVCWRKIKALDVAPTIQEIQLQIDEIRRKEIERTRKKLGTLTPEQEEAIERMTSSLTNKILQTSFAELRKLANQPDSIEKIELIRKLFRL